MHPPLSHEQPVTNLVSALALTAAPVSLWIRAAPVITVLVGCAGLVWYGILFVKEFRHWLRHRKRPRV